MKLPLLTADVVEAIALTCPSSSGGKDWIAVLRKSGLGTSFTLTVYFGRSGGSYQQSGKTVTFNQFTNLKNEKLGKGYNIIDTFNEPNMCWESQTPKISQKITEWKDKPVVTKDIIQGIKAPENALDLDF